MPNSPDSSIRLATILVVAAVSTLVTVAALAVPRPVPPGKVLLGVVGPDPAGFDRLTGQRHRLHLVFVAGGSGLSKVLEQDRADGRITIVSFRERGSPAAYARGDYDADLVATSEAANAVESSVWIRPGAEMNGHWSPWCSVDRSGRPRGPEYANTEFKRAFRRIAVIMRGGLLTEINARLRAAALPPLRSSVANLRRSGRVALLWNPQGEGSPNVAGNHPSDYWPGSAYVDYVGNDLYEIGGKAYWKGMDALYEAYRKPFVIAEWAPWGYDSPEFAQRMFAWVASHPRTLGLVYFNKGWSGGTGTFELRTKRRTLAVYRQAAKSARFSG